MISTHDVPLLVNYYWCKVVSGWSLGRKSENMLYCLKTVQCWNLNYISKVKWSWGWNFLFSLSIWLKSIHFIKFRVDLTIDLISMWILVAARFHFCTPNPILMRY